MKDFSIIIAHRGDPLGLWATIQSCEVELAGSGYDYEYCICVNGEEGAKKLSRYSLVGVDLQRILEYLGHSGKLGYLRIFQRPLSPPSARQFAMNEADGKYLFVLDNHCIVAKDYFKRALHDFDRYGADMVHSTTSWYVGDPTTCYHYELTLQNNFWAKGALIPEDHVRPYKIAAGGHGGFAVRADVWREVGGYWDGFNGYGGEEMYFDLKMAMLDKINYIDPKMIHWHYAGKRPYGRHYTDDYYRNMMMCANIIGGQEWLERVGESFITKFPRHKTPHYELMMQASAQSRPHAKWFESVRKRSLDDQLDLFRTQCIAH